MSADEEALLRAVLGDPGDVLARGAYADWLEEQGQPLRAEASRAATRKRRQELDQQIRGADPRPFSGAWDVHFETWEDGLPDAFLMMGVFRTKGLQAEAPEVFRARRIVRLRLGGDTRHWGRVADAPLLSVVQAFDPAYLRPDGAGAALLAASPRLAGLLSLELGHNGFGPEAVLPFLRPDNLPRLVHLGLANHRLGDEALEAVAARPLARLGMLSCQIGDERLLALLRSWALRGSLEWLDLRHCLLLDSGAEALASARMPRLRELLLSMNPLTEKGVRALARAPWLPGLRRLTLTGMRYDAAPGYLPLARAMVDSPGVSLVLDGRLHGETQEPLRDLLGERLALE